MLSLLEGVNWRQDVDICPLYVPSPELLSGFWFNLIVRFDTKIVAKI